MNRPDFNCIIKRNGYTLLWCKNYSNITNSSEVNIGTKISNFASYLNNMPASVIESQPDTKVRNDGIEYNVSYIVVWLFNAIAYVYYASIYRW